MERSYFCRPILWEQAVNWLAARLREYKVPFFTALITGLLAHGFAFTNKLVNADEVYYLFSKGATLISGRWGLAVMDLIFPNFSMPWIYGILSVLLFSVSACVVVNTFRIRNRLLQGLLAGLILSFPALTGTFCYMFTSTSYGVAFLLAVGAPWLMVTRCKWAFFPALGCLTVATGIYQPYIAIAAGFLVLILFQRLLHGEDVAKVVGSGFLYLALLLASLILYYVLMTAAGAITGVGMMSYRANGIQNSLTTIPENVVKAYKNFFLYFTDNHLGLIPTKRSQLAHGICLAASAVLLLLWELRVKTTPPNRAKLSRLLLMLALLGLMPLAINCIHVFTTNFTHTLVFYSFINVYVLFLILGDACVTLTDLSRVRAAVCSLCVHALTLALALVIVVNVYVANATYLNLHLRYEASYSFYTNLAANLQAMPEFDEDTKLAVIGNYTVSNDYWKHLSFLSNVMGAEGFTPTEYSAPEFLRHYLNFPVEMATYEETLLIQQTDTFAAMANYPYYGSIQWIGDTLVVKLS